MHALAGTLLKNSVYLPEWFAAMKLPDSEKNKYKFVFDLSVEAGLLNMTFHSLPFSPSMVEIDSCLMEPQPASILPRAINFPFLWSAHIKTVSFAAGLFPWKWQSSPPPANTDWDKEKINAKLMNLKNSFTLKQFSVYLLNLMFAETEQRNIFDSLFHFLSKISFKSEDGVFDAFR